MTERAILAGGRVFDGTGSEPFAADVAIDGARIVEVGLPARPARRAISPGERLRVTAPITADPGPQVTGAVVGWPRIWLRLEGLAALVAGVAGYRAAGGDWLWLVPALLAVDLSMAGYLAGPHPGAILYNVFHNWFTALLVLGAGLLAELPLVALAGWVLVAHVGMDRLAGYGLKYAPGFGDAHLGWIGRRRA